MMSRQGARASAARSAAARAAVFGVVWWAVAEGSSAGWAGGVAAVVAATAVSLWLDPPGGPRVRLRAVPGFAAWFLARSASGAVDVALRSLRRPVDVAPGLVHVPLALPVGWPRVAVADVVSLLPGTLAVEVLDDVLVVHVLDTGRPVRAVVGEVEQRVAVLAGLLAPGKGERPA